MDEIDQDEVRQRTISHYRERFAEHGATPRGVDWNGAESQDAHFAQLLKLLPAEVEADIGIDINDFGCGYGAFAGYLAERRTVSRYCGYDVNEDMIAAARSRYVAPIFDFDVADTPLKVADYGVASGIFTLRLGRSEDECWQALFDGIEALDRTSRRGFGFNCLTSYSDQEKMQDYLFYPDPLRVFHHCMTRYSRNVALLHDYGLFAFSVLVRKGDRP